MRPQLRSVWRGCWYVGPRVPWFLSSRAVACVFIAPDTRFPKLGGGVSEETKVPEHILYPPSAFLPSFPRIYLLSICLQFQWWSWAHHRFANLFSTTKLPFGEWHKECINISSSQNPLGIVTTEPKPRCLLPRMLCFFSFPLFYLLLFLFKRNWGLGCDQSHGFPRSTYPRIGYCLPAGPPRPPLPPADPLQGDAGAQVHATALLLPELVLFYLVRIGENRRRSRDTHVLRGLCSGSVSAYELWFSPSSTGVHAVPAEWKFDKQTECSTGRHLCHILLF